MPDPIVQIILATYNGAAFLREQLDSLLQQTFKDFTVLIRDDGSTDNTVSIINEYRQKYPGVFALMIDNRKNLGATQNFALLLNQTIADYIFFCDQDDIWLADKMEKSLEKIRHLENEDIAIPCMVFTDMKSINEQGICIANSVWQQLHLHPDFFILNRLLIQNIPHGCTMVINKAMRNLACPIPKEAILHDHWIALLAVSCGKFDSIDEPTMLLRNHPASVTRKQLTVWQKIKKYFVNFVSGQEYERYITLRVSQAKALQLRTSTFIQDKDFDLLKRFLLLGKTRGIARKKIFLQNKFYRTTCRHTFKMIWRA